MEWKQAMMSQWSCESFQSLCPLLIEVLSVFPLFSLFLKWLMFSLSSLKWGKWAFIHMLKKWHFVWQSLARHGDLSFLCRWVSATSLWSDETAFFHQAEFLLAMAKCFCPVFPTLWNCSPLSRLAKYFAWQDFCSPWRSSFCPLLFFLVLAWCFGTQFLHKWVE